MPSTELLTAMTRFNEELVKAGVMLAGEACTRPKGAKVRFEGGKRTVTDGPFTEAKELVGGYWIWECASRDEAIEWLKRAPFDDGTEIQLRQVFEDEDFDDEMTPELREAQSSCASRPRRASRCRTRPRSARSTPSGGSSRPG